MAALEKARNHQRMTRRKPQSVGVADPAKRQPFDKRDDDVIVVNIETPKDLRNRYACEVDEHVFELQKVLRVGMTYEVLAVNGAAAARRAVKQVRKAV